MRMHAETRLRSLSRDIERAITQMPPYIRGELDRRVYAKNLYKADTPSGVYYVRFWSEFPGCVVTTQANQNQHEEIQLWMFHLSELPKISTRDETHYWIPNLIDDIYMWALAVYKLTNEFEATYMVANMEEE